MLQSMDKPRVKAVDSAIKLSLDEALDHAENGRYFIRLSVVFGISIYIYCKLVNFLQ